MTPNYDLAAAKAAETAVLYKKASPLEILRCLPNVRTFSFSLSPSSDGDFWDACTLVRDLDGTLQYIILYNGALPQHQLNKALARELGHVILQHDGTGPEEIWAEESTCFAYHLICAKPVVTICFRPYRSTLSSSFKDARTFASMDELKRVIAEEKTRSNRFIGKSTVCLPEDVQILRMQERDIYAGWNNYSSVILDGKPVGYCGEVQ